MSPFRCCRAGVRTARGVGDGVEEQVAGSAVDGHAQGRRRAIHRPTTWRPPARRGPARCREAVIRVWPGRTIAMSKWAAIARRRPGPANLRRCSCGAPESCGCRPAPGVSSEDSETPRESASAFGNAAIPPGTVKGPPDARTTSPVPLPSISSDDGSAARACELMTTTSASAAEAAATYPRRLSRGSGGKALSRPRSVVVQPYPWKLCHVQPSQR